MDNYIHNKTPDEGDQENVNAVLHDEEPPAAAAIRDLPMGQRLLATGVKDWLNLRRKWPWPRLTGIRRARIWATPQGFDRNKRLWR